MIDLSLKSDQNAVFFFSLFFTFFSSPHILWRLRTRTCVGGGSRDGGVFQWGEEKKVKKSEKKKTAFWSDFSDSQKTHACNGITDYNWCTRRTIVLNVRRTKCKAMADEARGDLGPLSAIYLILKQMADDRPLAAINGQLILLRS